MTSYHSIFNESDPREADRLLRPTREEIIRSLGDRRFDVVIVGGGIHGVSAARIAALNGLRVALLEAKDFAQETSSRSSKMAHGGLRYLELFDFEQVKEGIAAREELFRTAAHLAKPQDFFVSTAGKGLLYRLKLKAGLSIYDFLTGGPAVRHRSTAGGFLYTDGIMDDARIVMETMLSARQEGALCLNYAEVILCRHNRTNDVSISWVDGLTGEKRELETSAVLNCAGPWVASMGRITPAEFAGEIAFSRGSHLLFSRPWDGPALILPLPEKSRYYFVWPHPAGTMVGTTEREMKFPEKDSKPSREEIEEILSRVERDLPARGLDRTSLHYCFSGVRTLALRDRGGTTARLSRKHRWVYSQGAMSLIGGKFTTASWTAFEGLKQLVEIGGNKIALKPLGSRKLPGCSGDYEGSIREFADRARSAGAPENAIARASSRLGGRVRFLSDAAWLRPIGGRLLEGEVRIAIEQEAACSVEDLMRRRLELEYEPDHGLPVLGEVAAILSKYFPDRDFGAECDRYRERMRELHELMGIRPVTA